MADALVRSVRREREYEPADERGSARQPELPQPRARDRSRGDVEEQHERVPRDDGAEQRVKRPERNPERPSLQVQDGLRFWPERIRVTPWSGTALELVPDEPPVVERLEVVAGRGLAVSRRAAGEEAGARGVDRGPRRRDGG